MSLKSSLIILSGLVILLLAAIFSFSSGDKPAQAPKAASAQATSSSQVSSSSPDAKSEVQEKTQTAAAAPSDASVPQSEKDQIINKLYDCSATPTQESVKTVEPYLLSSDLTVRNAAIEAMKQLSLPSAARALRDAAARSSSPSDKAEFLKAAEFVELPPYIPRSQRTAPGN